ncbi:MAG: chromate transporter [Polyangiaceae bacterium]
MRERPLARRDERTKLRELAVLFLRLGTTAFGGPAAHIAMMEDEVVRRRGWLTHERFLDLLGATNLIPGPNSTEMAIHIGWERRRLPGLVVAGVSFIVPAALITAALGWVYVRYGAVPAAGAVLHGVKPVMLAIVAQAIYKLVPKAARTPKLRVLGVLALVLTAAGLHELAVLFGAGLLSAATAPRAKTPAKQADLGPSPRSDETPTKQADPDPSSRGGEAPTKHAERDKPAPSKQSASRTPSDPGGSAMVLAAGSSVAAAAGAASVTLPALFWFFLKIGSVLFGSGYVLLAFLRTDLVERLHWLTEAQLLDAIAVGQVTPGPVFTTATFIGYVLAGPAGAGVATAGIFVPAFVFVALSGPLVPRMRASRVAGAFLDGVNVASLALMVAVTVQLARAALVDVPTVAIALASAYVLVRHDKVNATWLILGGALVGWAARALAS